MKNQLVPASISDRFEVHEWRHGLSILTLACSEQWQDILNVLSEFELRKSDILAPGGRKSSIAARLDQGFYKRGWHEKKFETKIVVDEVVYEAPTHKVDCVKGRVAVEVEWNNKDPFFDRDLNNFRLLFDLRAIDVGVIITRCSDLQNIFNALGKGKSYGNSTTHMDKLLPRINGGSGGGCPIIVFGISQECYVDDIIS